ncbi:MAG: diaminopimelate decarboxylase [Lachnospiraceae bacterium]|nr:diaminopimelate decarboxylase [Lachnospiraceae bacterium]
MVKEIKDGILYFDGCSTTELAKEYGTPLYVMSQTDIESRFLELKKDFIDKYKGARVAYASKAFCSTGMFKLCEKMGASIDVVSGGELYTAKAAHFPPERIEFNGNNKLMREIDEAVEYGVGRFILDGVNELPLIEAASKKHGKQSNILIRITPGVAASTHDYIVTGKLDSKFGIPLDDDILLPIVKAAIESPHLNFLGFHMHIGSQLFTNSEYLEALGIVLEKVEQVKREFSYDISEINLGGGFGVTYTNEERKPYSFFLDPMMELIGRRASEIGIPFPAVVIEPGRSIVAEAGISLYTIGQIKDIPGVRKYVSVDGGMGDNIRVALYEAVYDGIIANKADKKPTDKVTVCGKYCESGDILMRDFLIPEGVEAGDILAMYSTGAYGYAMASHYNFNPIPGVVLVNKGKSGWLIKPQTYEQLTENHMIPDFI